MLNASKLGLLLAVVVASACDNSSNAVLNVNTPPEGADASITTSEDVPLMAAMTASDPDGDVISISVIDDVQNGALVITPDGAGGFNASYTPDTDFNGTDLFRFTVSDDRVSAGPFTVDITVTAVNDAPLASNAATSVDEDVVLSGTLAATDAEGDTLSFRAVDDPGNGILLVNADGSYVYTPNSDFNGMDQFTFSANDGVVDSSPATVAVTVAAVNDAPVGVADNLVTNEDMPLTVATPGVLGNDTDIDGDAITATMATAPSNGALMLNADGSLVYTPNANFSGMDMFSYLINDGSVNSAPVAAMINVNAVNDTPVANALGVTTSEDAAVNAVLSGSDVENSPLMFALTSMPANGTLSGFDPATGMLTYTPNADFSGDDNFTFRVNDGAADSVDALVSITVTPVNDLPTAIAIDNGVVDEEQAVGAAIGMFTTTDADPTDTHTYSLIAGIGDTDNASFSITGNVLQTAAVLDFETQNILSLRVQTDDGAGGTFAQIFVIGVNDINDAPTDVSLSNSSVDENLPAATTVGTFTSTDPDSAGPFSYALVAGAGAMDNASFAVVGDQLQTAAAFDFETQNNFSIRIQTDDGDGGTLEKVFSVTVNDVNDAPDDIGLSNSSIDENLPAGSAVGILTSTDADTAGPFVYALVAGVGDTDNASFVVVGDQLQTAAAFDFETQSSFSVRIQTDDGAGGTFEEIFSVTVNDVNDAPSDIALSNAGIDENLPAGSVVGTIASTDADTAGPFIYALVAGAGDTDNASFAIVADQLQSAVTFDFETQNSFDIRVQTDDGAGGTFEEALTITINDINDAPTDMTLDSSDVDENLPAGSLVGNLTTTDPDVAATHTYIMVAGAGDTDNVSFAIAGSQLESAASFDFETQNSYTVRIQTDDGAGGTFEQAFTITVNDINDAPTDIAVDNADVDENQAIGTAVGTFTSTDVDSTGPFGYALVAGAGDTDNAAFAIVGDQLQTAAVFDFETQNSFNIRVQSDDGASGTFEEAFVIAVNDLNDAPTDIALSGSSVDENLPAGTAVATLTSVDVDSAAFSFDLVAGAGDTDNASFTIVGDQLQTNTPFDFETQNSFSVRIQTDDGAGGTYEEAFVVTINDVNEAPTDIALDSSDVDENQAAGTAVGTLSSTDVDSAVFTYTLVAGAGDTDNASFGISGAVLETAAIFDFETQNSFSIRLQTDDGAGGLYEEAFTITINDLNDAPTDIALDSSDVDENQAAGTAVGTFSATDVDSAAFTYTLVAGAGDTDNAFFGITGGVLESAAIFDFETQNSYSIRVQTDDGAGGLFEEAFTITVNDLNDDPSDIALDSTDIDENQAAGTAVGTFSTTDVDSAAFSYTLVAGAGDTDNAAFGIAGAVLETAAIFDFETQDTYSIRVQTDDGAGGLYEEAITITVNDLNDAPTDIALDNMSVGENQPAGTAVGTLATTDADTVDTHTYTLVAGAGDTDNAQFALVGAQLQTAAVLDFETAANCTTSATSCSIRVQTDDGNGGQFEKTFIIGITNANDDPTDIAISNSGINENEPIGTAVGTFSTTDQDTADTHTYTLIAGAGDTDNAQFTIAGAQLESAAVFDFETAASCTTSVTTCSIRVQTNDGNGGVYAEVLIINILDVLDPNAAPLAVNDDYTGAIGNTNFALVAAPSGTSTPPTVQLVGTVIGNDTDTDTGDTLSATPDAAIPTTQGGSVAIDAAGRFIYTPAAGFPSGTADSFDYEVCDDGTPSMCDTGTVTIAGTGIVWYVDDSSPNNPGSGTAADPFRNLSSAGGPSLPGETIFVFAGTQTTGIGLQNNQSLLGEGLPLVVNTTTLVNGGTRPVIANAGGAAVMLASGNTVRGLDITGSREGIVGTAFGTLTADNVAISTSGGAGIDLSNGAGSVTFDSVSSSASSGAGIDLNLVSGSFTIFGGAISGSDGNAIDITSSTATVSYGGSITAGSVLAVNITGQTANMVSLTNTITSIGKGILLDNNTGGTINLSGGMTLSTGTDPAFTATNGGTVNVVGTNSLTTTTGTAVTIDNTTIGASGVTFRSVSSDGGLNPGIVLDSTGSGTFFVSGTGTSGSGGTIENKTGDAITMSNTAGPITLWNMIIEDIGDTAGGFDTRSQHDAIHAQTVTGGLSLSNVIIRRVSDMCINGASFVDGISATTWNGLEILNSTIEDCNRWHVASTGDTSDEGAVRIVGLTGTVTIDNSVIQRGGELLDLITHTTGTLTMNVTNSAFSDAFKEFTSGGTVAIGQSCIDVTVAGSANANVTIGGPGIGNAFVNCANSSIRVSKNTVPSGSSDIVTIVDNNTFRVTDHTPANGIFGNTPQGGVSLRAGPGAIDTFDAIVSNNTFGVAVGPDDDIGSTTDEVANADGVGGNVALIFERGVSQVRVNDNTFNGSLNAPWVNRADGNTSAAVLYEDNSYRGRADYCCDSGFTFRVPGIPYRSQVRNSGNLDITFRNDQFAVHDQFFFFGTETLEFESRIGGGTMCIALDGTSSPDGYEFDELVGTINLYQGTNNHPATGPCGVAHVAPPGNPCESELADDGVRGGADNHDSVSGTPTPGLVPPHVDIDNGSISIVPTACTVPVGTIFVP